MNWKTVNLVIIQAVIGAILVVLKDAVTITHLNWGQLGLVTIVAGLTALLTQLGTTTTAISPSQSAMGGVNQQEERKFLGLVKVN